MNGRRAVRRLTVVLSAVVVALLGLPACAGAAGSQRQPIVSRGLRAGTFAAISFDGPANLYDVSTGLAIRTLLPETRGDESLTDLEQLTHGDLLATFHQGIHCLNGQQECPTSPTGCGGEILKVDPTTGDEHTLWRVGPKLELDGATASPDGRQIAALVEPCSYKSYFSAHLLIRRLSDARTWTIGRKLATCHWLSAPVWTADGHAVVVSYGASSEQPSAARLGIDGTNVSCPVWQRIVQVRFNPDHSQPSLHGTVRRPPKHCDLSTPVIRAGRIFDVKTCDAIYNSVRTYIERLSRRMQPVKVWRLGACDQGADLSLNASGRLLASTYDFCNPPLPGHKLRNPVSHLYRLRHHRIVRIASAKGGDLAWSDMVS